MIFSDLSASLPTLSKISREQTDLVTPLPADLSGRMLGGRRDVVLFAVPSRLDAMGRSRHDGESISFRSRSREKRESIRSYGGTWTRSFRSASARESIAADRCCRRRRESRSSRCRGSFRKTFAGTTRWGRIFTPV